MRIQIISKVFWAFEYIFFYPRLKKVLNKIKIMGSYDDLDGTTILDVGGHSGQTINIFKKIFRKSMIYSFEPNPVIFKKLKKLNSKNVICSNVGIGSRVEESEFYVSKFSEASSLRLPSPNSKWNLLKLKVLGLNYSEMYNKIEINLITIDHFMEQNTLSDIFLLKIDVEGSELEVLKGALGSLSSKRIKFIQLEELRNDSYEDSFFEIDNLLVSMGMHKLFSIRHPVGNFFEHIYG